MYDQSKLSELIRFARIKAGSTVIDVSQATATDPSPFFRHRGTRGGSTASCRRSRPLQDDPVGRMRTLAKSWAERTSKPSADLVAMPKVTNQRCPVAAPVLPRSSHHADPEEGRDGCRLQSSRLRAAEARWVLRHRDHAAAAGAGTGDAQPCIGSTLRPSARRWRRPASCSMRKAPCSRTRIDAHSIKVFDPRSGRD